MKTGAPKMRQKEREYFFESKSDKSMQQKLHGMIDSRACIFYFFHAIAYFVFMKSSRENINQNLLHLRTYANNILSLNAKVDC
ncbi:hypothetical protein BpHYR1_049166 [Brachionus plicatilis]|uniref:Uncharacterized protein n=1 Tax=Brachionus plicatilis TaxID=10195 RepID=A0A3M7QVE9_BRAPC|nr:hypothetical protein BpHYR1_049166 [Brachionus plicatilis]